jgi:hypothetical protein
MCRVLLAWCGSVSETHPASRSLLSVSMSCPKKTENYIKQKAVNSPLCKPLCVNEKVSTYNNGICAIALCRHIMRSVYPQSFAILSFLRRCTIEGKS